VGLELRPRKLREAAAMWEALEAARGQGGRDAVWAHPDLLPTAADLERPDTFVTATDPEAIADLERALGSLGQDIEALEMGTGPESPEAGESADGDTDEPGAASKD
jgi:hypothetical protein